jgi:hypothetical protein
MDRRAGRFFRKFERILNLAPELQLDFRKRKVSSYGFANWIAAKMVKEGFCSFVDFFSMKDEVFFAMVDSIYILEKYERSFTNRQ